MLAINNFKIYHSIPSNQFYVSATNKKHREQISVMAFQNLWYTQAK